MSKMKNNDKDKDNDFWYKLAGGIIFLVIICFGIAIIHPKCVNIVSIATGLTSIGLGVYAIIQSTIYNKESSELNDTMMKHLGGIENSQGTISEQIAVLLKSINQDPDLTYESKQKAGAALSDLSSQVVVVPQSPIQKMARYDVAEKVESKIETFYRKAGKNVEGYSDLRVEDVLVKDKDKSLAFNISVRSGLVVPDWPVNVASEFFTEKSKAYYASCKITAAASDYCVVLMIYANSIYYCICNVSGKKVIDKIDTSNINIIENDCWIDALNDAIEQFIQDSIYCVQ